jgi:hypothetical protein
MSTETPPVKDLKRLLGESVRKILMDLLQFDPQMREIIENISPDQHGVIFSLIENNKFMEKLEDQLASNDDFKESIAKKLREIEDDEFMKRLGDRLASNDDFKESIAEKLGEKVDEEIASKLESLLGN